MGRPATLFPNSSAHTSARPQTHEPAEGTEIEKRGKRTFTNTESNVMRI